MALDYYSVLSAGFYYDPAEGKTDAEYASEVISLGLLDTLPTHEAVETVERGLNAMGTSTRL